MLAGIDPFHDDDPTKIFANILSGKLKFPDSFDKKAKNLVRHLLDVDVTHRLGCQSGGVQDIKDDLWFAVGFSWDAIFNKTAKPPFLPVVKDDGDTENYAAYPDSPELPEPLARINDPFKDWYI